MFPLSGWAGAGQGGVAQLAPHMPVTARRGSLQLWQFLIAMLEVSRHSALVAVMLVVLQDPANCGAITWTGRGMEFKLIEPEEVRGGSFIQFSVSRRLLFFLVKSQEIKHYLFLIENKIVPTDRKTFMVLVLTQIRVIFRNYIAGNVRIVRLSDCTRW